MALRIPIRLAEDAHLREGAEVELAVEDGRLVVVPVVAAALSLDALVAGITPKNLHGEQFTDPARGHEAW